jgi:pimeloyl-ACP methyl ester carboxylesterase
METIVHHARETAFRVSDRGGEGPTVCFVHGAGGSNAVWKAQHRLADEFPVVTVDCSGHGASDDIDTRPGFTTLSAYADDVLAVIEETGADVLVGHSLGGAVLQHILLERTVDLEGIVLAGTGARLPIPRELRSVLDGDDSAALDDVIQYLNQPGRLFADPDDELRTISAAALRDCGPSVLERDFRTCHRFDVRDHLDEIEVPALAVVGQADQLTPPWYHRQLATSLPDCAFAAIDDAGHFLMLERPTAFNRVIGQFVDSIMAVN